MEGNWGDSPKKQSPQHILETLTDGFIQLFPSGNDRSQHRQYPHGGTEPHTRAEHDEYRHDGHGRLRGANQTHRRSRRRIRAPHGTRHPRSRKPAQHQRRPPCRRLHGASRGGHPFQSERGRRSRKICGESAHQPGQLHRSGTHIQTSGVHRRGVCPGATEAPRPLCPLPPHLQGEPHGHPHRREPRFAVGPHHVPLRRHARRHGGVVHGVPAHLCRRAFHGRGHLHQSVEHGGDGTHRAPTDWATPSASP